MIWKDVPGFSGRYEVSNTGLVRSVERRVRNTAKSYRTLPAQIIQPFDHSAGYLCVKLSKNRRKRNLYVHRLVCEAFYGPPPKLHEVRHLDGNKKNNNLGNLRWGTKQENFADRIGHGCHVTGERHGMAKLTRDDVVYIRKSSRMASRLAERFGVCVTTITNIRTFKTWRHLDTPSGGTAL